MMQRINLKTVALVFALVLSLVATSASSIFAQQSATKYPEREVRIVVAAQAGGGDDRIVQLFKPYLEKHLGQRVVFDYKPGANMTTAWAHVVHNTRPDGYTLPMSKIPHLQAAEITMKNEKQHSWEDIVPVYNVVSDPNILIVAADSPFQTLQDYIEYASENPEAIVVADTSMYGDDWIANMKLQREVRKTYPQFAVTYVSFVSDPLVIQSLLGGHIDAAMLNVSGVYDLIQDGRARGLVVFNDERLDIIPDVPTARELGYDIINSSSRGFAFRRGTPEEIVGIMEEALRKAAAEPEFRERAQAAGLYVVPMDREQYTRVMNEELKVLEEIFAEVGN